MHSGDSIGSGKLIDKSCCDLIGSATVMHVLYLSSYKLKWWKIFKAGTFNCLNIASVADCYQVYL